MSIVSGSQERRLYPSQLGRAAVELCRRSGKSLVVIAEELGIATEWFRSWLRELRRKPSWVEQERDSLQRAAPFFARETEMYCVGDNSRYFATESR